MPRVMYGSVYRDVQLLVFFFEITALSSILSHYLLPVYIF